MTPLATITLAARDWLWPAGLAFALGALLIAWGHGRSPLGARWRWGLSLLKGVALGAFLLALTEPSWVRRKPVEGANTLALAVDDSQSMTLRGEGGAESRGERVRGLLLEPDASWIREMERVFQVRRYAFDARLRGVGGFGELGFQGRSSAVSGALKELGERLKGSPSAGILLFTDGASTDGVEAPEGLPPVYPVLVGAEGPRRDLSLLRVVASQTAFEDAPVTVEAELRATGLAGRKVRTRLHTLGVPAVAADLGSAAFHDAPLQLGEEIATVDGEEARMVVRFQVNPPGPGVHFLRVAAEVLDGAADGLEEATLRNNARLVVVDRGRGPYRILYVGGRPNWEFKFLNRAVLEDPQVRLSGLIRIARREPKFSFLGRGGTASNPLYRGFDKVDEETERYDQPVMIRLNTVDDAELKSGFPKTAEELFGFHAVVVDDLEAAFFTAGQLRLLRQFVAERGGGFLMLGGPDSLAEGGYARTPVGDLLPVYLDRAPGETPDSYRLDFTREGMLQPWVRLRPTEMEETARMGELPALRALNRVRGVKPGATPLAMAEDARGESSPAMVAQRYGLGRAAAFAVGDFWRLGLREPSQGEDLARFWRQTARWLVSDTPRRVEALAGEGDGGGLTGVRITARTSTYQPLENAKVELFVYSPTPFGETNTAAAIRLQPEPSASQAGEYDAAFLPRESGPTLIFAKASDESGVLAGEALAGHAADPLADEFKNLSPDREALERLAARTGGKVLSLEEVAKFVGGLPSRALPSMETELIPLWHTAAWLAAALGCLLAEWGLRRWKGLA